LILVFAHDPSHGQYRRIELKPINKRRWEMTIREMIEKLTKEVRNQVELDALVSKGALRTIRDEFPDSDPAEIMYEWDSMKLKIKKMV